MERLAKLGAHVLFLDEPAYPPLLALLDDAPPVIAVLGEPARSRPSAVALVGGRNASANGQRMAESLAAALARPGSSWSRAWRAASMPRRTGARCAPAAPSPPSPAGSTGPIRRSTPTCSAASPKPARWSPRRRSAPPRRPGTFPRRNRIIAGLALGVVVVEAALRSGSLITARLAQEAGRELFAVPGSPLDPRCHGSNDLIRQGAHLTETAADVLENLPDHPSREGLAGIRCSPERPPACEPPATGGEPLEARRTA